MFFSILSYPLIVSEPLKLLFDFKILGPDLLSKAEGFEGAAEAAPACLPRGTYATFKKRREKRERLKN